MHAAIKVRRPAALHEGCEQPSILFFLAAIIQTKLRIIIMLRSQLALRADALLPASKRRLRRVKRGSGISRCLGWESLEQRTLLTTFNVDLVNFSFSPSAVTVHVGDTVH